MVGEGGYLENPPELVSHAAESSQKVTDEKGLGGAAAPQDHQALAQALCSRELRSNISVQRFDRHISGLHPQHFTNEIRPISCCGSRQEEAWKNLHLAEGLRTLHLNTPEIRALEHWRTSSELMEPDLCR